MYILTVKTILISHFLFSLTTSVNVNLGIETIDFEDSLTPFSQCTFTMLSVQISWKNFKNYKQAIRMHQLIRSISNSTVISEIHTSTETENCAMRQKLLRNYMA